VTDAYQYTKQDKRKTVKMKDLEAVLRDNELYDFLLTDSSIMLRNQGKDDSDGKRARLNEAGAPPTLVTNSTTTGCRCPTSGASRALTWRATR
jgi:hypothetical protein